MITMNGLIITLQHKLGIPLETAKTYAGIVMDLFGFENRIIDNLLSPYDRQLFYMLEKHGILGTERDEVVLHDGRRWRLHYWILNESVLLHLNLRGKWYQKLQPISSSGEEETIYAQLPKEFWGARKTVS